MADFLRNEGFGYLIASILFIALAIILGGQLGIIQLEVTSEALTWFVMILSIIIAGIMVFIGIKKIYRD